MIWPFRRRHVPAPAPSIDWADIDLDPQPSGRSGGQLQPAANAQPEEEELQPWAMHIAALILAEVKLEEVHRGRPYTDEEREVVIDAHRRRLVAKHIRSQQHLQALSEMREVLEQIAEGSSRIPGLLQQQIDRQPLERLEDLWRRHPFLVGFFGADLVHRIKGR